MKKELQEKLFQKYPKIFIKHNPSQYPFDQRGIECWSGWYDLIDNLCFNIQEYIDKNKLPQIEFLQVKQKFAALRVYTSGADKYINNLIDNAEEESLSICEACGTKDDVSQNKDFYILTLCPNCRNKDNRE